MNRLLTLRLLSDDSMKREHPGVFGFALQGGNLIVVSTDLLSNPFAKGTLAHELGHTQSFRALGRFSTKRAVPGLDNAGIMTVQSKIGPVHLSIAFSIPIWQVQSPRRCPGRFSGCRTNPRCSSRFVDGQVDSFL